MLTTAPVHSVDDDPEAVYEYAYERGWTDGLPIIPPTPERVQRMLQVLDRDPQEVIVELAPRYGAATLERLAVNAVMAGCRPEYLPVLIAALRAIARPEFNLHGVQCTTNPVAPLLIVNGPIARRIGINAGRNCLGQGTRANATIGRALRLLLLNVGGGLPGSVDQATHGMPGKLGLCFAEDEENSPWQPLHVDRGLEASQSAVTVVGVQGTNNICPIYQRAESILHWTANALATIGHNNVILGGGNVVVVFPWGHARLLTEQGFTKSSIRAYLWEKSQIPVADYPPEGNIPTGKWHLDGDRACVTQRPEDILVVCAGGPEPYHITCLPTFGDTWAVTEPIDESPPARADG